MCLTLRKAYKRKRDAETKKSRKPFIAKKDITVYKHLSANMRSPYLCKSYQIGETYNVRAFSFKVQKLFSPNEYRLEIEKGLHAYAQIPAISSNEIIVECVIPKGTEYYRGRYNDIVCKRLTLSHIKNNP